MSYVIIGNSAAGISAAQQIRKLDKSGQILIISKEKEAAYSRCLLPDFIAGDIGKEQLSIRNPDFYQENNIKTLFQTDVIGVDTKNNKVLLEDGGSIHYQKLLIATGSKPFTPPVKGIQKAPTYTLNSFEDAQRILEASINKQRIVIVGGGFIGLELALALNKRGKEIVVLEKAPRILSLQLDDTAAGLLEKEIAKTGIELKVGIGLKEIIPNSKILRFFGAKDIKGVNLDDGTLVPCDMVIFATGTKPNIEFLKDTGISTNRGILVDQFMSTNIENIYAAGDVAETQDVVTGGKALSPIWPNAIIQGKYAGANMAGSQRKFVEQVSMQNTSEFREIPFISVGLVNPANLDQYEVLTYHNEKEGVYRKVVLQDDIPVGMIFFGDISSAGVVAGFIRSKKNAKKVKHSFLSTRYNYTRQLAN